MELNLFGAFRSGTNYLRALLELNYQVEVVPGAGFKHAPLPATCNGPVVGIVKDPFSWLESMWRYVQDRGSRHTLCGTTWKTFLKEPLVVFHGDVPGFPRYRFASPVDYWNAMAYNLLSLDPERARIIRYEDLLSDPHSTIEDAARWFGLERSGEGFQTLRQRTRNLGPRRQQRAVPSYVTGEAFDPRYFLERRYMQEFSWPQHRRILRSLDQTVTETFHYPV